MVLQSQEDGVMAETPRDTVHYRFTDYGFEYGGMYLDRLHHEARPGHGSSVWIGIGRLISKLRYVLHVRVTEKGKVRVDIEDTDKFELYVKGERVNLEGIGRWRGDLGDLGNG